jgi:hypothetical protein
MDRAGSLELVRALTRPVVELFCPQKLSAFEEEFAAFALTAGVSRVSEKAALFRPRPQSLDTTLVAGMFFQVLVEAQKLPAGTPQRVSYVRKEAKNFLVKHLAGEITLSRFYRLLSLIEENVQNYFESLGSEWLSPRPSPGKEIPTESRPRPQTIKEEELRQALAGSELLKQGRLVTPEGLVTFFKETEGRWFRVLDLEEHFKVNKKTAWTYLNLLLKAGFLEHNGEKANRVRYTLARAFKPPSSTPQFPSAT